MVTIQETLSKDYYMSLIANDDCTLQCWQSDNIFFDNFKHIVCYLPFFPGDVDWFKSLVSDRVNVSPIIKDEEGGLVAYTSSLDLSNDSVCDSSIL